MPALLRKINYLKVWRAYQKVWGVEMFHPSLDRWLYLTLHRLGLMGRSERKIIESLLHPGMSVLDVGGNIGLYTLLFSQLVGEKGSVLTLEPVPELRKAILKSIARNQVRNVKVLPYAAGAREESVHLALDAFNSGNNWLSPQKKAPSSVEVPVRRLDHLLENRSPDFVKIDVQGWEVEVLKGMSGLLSAAKRPIILCEISAESLKTCGTSVRELGQVLSSYFYTLHLPKIVGEKIELEALSLEALEEKASLHAYFDIVALPPIRHPELVEGSASGN